MVKYVVDKQYCVHCRDKQDCYCASRDNIEIDSKLDFMLPSAHFRSLSVFCSLDVFISVTLKLDNIM